MQLQKKQELITLDLLFSKLTRYDIYKYYIPVPFKIGVSFNSIFRKDPTPSMSVYEGKDGKLHHIDYGASEYKGGPIDLVMQLYQLPLHKAIDKIARDFQLIGGTDNYKKITETYKQPIINRKVQCKIQVTTKPWTEKDKEYWKSYGITLKDLKENNIYSVGELYVNRKRYPLKSEELCYCYWYPDGMKIYLPEREKGQKWLSSISTSKVEGLEKLNGHPEVIITKASKDRILLTKLFPQLEIISVQNESGSGLTDEVLEKLKGKKIYINFDNDPPGKRASTIQTQRIGCYHINVPDNLYKEEGIKDFSDWYKARGDGKEIVQHFIDKKIVDI